MIKTTKQLQYWQGKFGDDYTQRNYRLNIFYKRQSFFSSLLQNYPQIKSILEIGCNMGGNLKILHNINFQLELTAIEPNYQAVKLAQKLVPEAKIASKNIFDIRWKKKFDLVFTSGVLIHIADKDLSLALRKIFTASKKYILTIEYFASKNTAVKYRGLPDALFKRPYDKIWQQYYPELNLLNKGLLKKSQGFDNCHWWLYKKEV